jgi:hypothetical protein
MLQTRSNRWREHIASGETATRPKYRHAAEKIQQAPIAKVCVQR